MYIQPQADAPTSGIYLPRDYSGNAFTPQSEPIPEPKENLPPAQDLPQPAPSGEARAPCESEATECSSDPSLRESVETGAFFKRKPDNGCYKEEQRAQSPGGLWGKFPFLGSLLPPPRHCKEQNAQGILSGGGRDLLLIGAMAYLLFFDQSDDGILPLLLLLLLWE